MIWPHVCFPGIFKHLDWIVLKALIKPEPGIDALCSEQLVVRGTAQKECFAVAGLIVIGPRKRPVPG